MEKETIIRGEFFETIEKSKPMLDGKISRLRIDYELPNGESKFIELVNVQKIKIEAFKLGKEKK